MSVSWIPLKDADLLAFASNFSALITATPTAYSLVAADATSLAGYLTAYSTALGIATTPATRTAVTLTNKDVAKATLVADMRALAKRIQATASVTPGQKTNLGLPVHKSTPTPIPAPATKPVLSVSQISSGRTITVRLADELTPTKNAKPIGVEGAEIYTYVPTADEAPPTDFSKWRFEGIATRATFDIVYEGSDIGKVAYIAANWFNPRGEAGAPSDAVTATVAA